MSRPEPTSSGRVLSGAFGMSSPSTVAEQSIGRHHRRPRPPGCPNRVRNDCSPASTSSSPISISPPKTVSAGRGLIFGRMSTSAVITGLAVLLLGHLIGPAGGWTSDSAPPPVSVPAGQRIVDDLISMASGVRASWLAGAFRAGSRAAAPVWPALCDPLEIRLKKLGEWHLRCYERVGAQLLDGALHGCAHGSR